MKKNYHVNKGKVKTPKNVVPMGATNIITDNITDEKGYTY